MATDAHLLQRLRFPARYEGLVDALGPEVVRVLVTPADETLQLFQRVGLAVPNRAEGLFIPIVADSGTGKTTLASNLSSFLGELFSDTVAHEGAVVVDQLVETAEGAVTQLVHNDKRVVPILIDNRESSEANDTELAAIKQFLRRPGTGSRSVIVWPETSTEVATSLAQRYRQVAGSAPISLPLAVQGPQRQTWRSVATTTMRLVNGLNTLDDLGVDPDTYEPHEYPSLGEYLRRIADDFTGLVHSMLTATTLPVGLVVLFASSSADAGVLSQLTSGTEFGLLDPNALVDATPDSVIGRWWNGRRGLLTQVVVRLDARAFCAPPAVVVPALRRFGDPVLKDPLEQLGVDLRSEAEVLKSFGRSDVGRFLAGETRAAYESRGTPATTSEAAFDALAEHVGFSGGRDKLANRALASMLNLEKLRHEIDSSGAVAEAKLPFAPVVPDIRLDRERSYMCIEITWRKGQFLGSSARSDVSQYLLTKLRNYGRELGWIPSDG